MVFGILGPGELAFSFFHSKKNVALFEMLFKTHQKWRGFDNSQTMLRFEKLQIPEGEKHSREETTAKQHNRGNTKLHQIVFVLITSKRIFV